VENEYPLEIDGVARKGVQTGLEKHHETRSNEGMGLIRRPEPKKIA